jgi:phosphatidylcholine synthase
MGETYPALMPSNRDKALAWGVHLFTASGAVWGLLGIISVMQQEWKTAFLWFIVATFVDGVDGLLARRFKVKGVLPDFDGALLDNILDYLTYVILPALFIYNYSGMLPEGWELFGAGLISVASAYQFCQADAKTDDHTFKGFPSYWNVVVFYLYLLALNPWVNLAILIVLSILVFVPIKYAYPSRMRRYQQPTIFLAAVWGIMLLIAWAQIPDPTMWLVYASVAFLVYYVGISLLMMWQNREKLT